MKQVWKHQERNSQMQMAGVIIYGSQQRKKDKKKKSIKNGKSLNPQKISNYKGKEKERQKAINKETKKSMKKIVEDIRECMRNT